MSDDKTLPYDFDLHYDIKTLDQLKLELTSARAKIETLESLIKHHKINLDE